jgi:hypothetical protein
MSDDLLMNDEETTAPRPDFTVKVISPEVSSPDDGPAVEGSRENLWAIAAELAKQRVAAGADPGRVTTQFNPAGDTEYKDAKIAACLATAGRDTVARGGARHGVLADGENGR